jgi:polyprenyl-phospho-N-acetylgalactosaminyl synthase
LNKTCLLIPVYDHPDCLGELIRGLSVTGLHCLLVNDGSAAHCSQLMRDIAGELPWVSLVERARNGGKGAAVKTGMAEAVRLGYTHVLQVDADGQHELADIPRLLALSAEHPLAVISGEPYFTGAPKLRYYGRYMTHIWVWINTLSMDIRDSMCGFRVYPLQSSLQVIRSNRVGDHMDFDPEILVRLHWVGVPVIPLRTLVSYPIDGISHFRGFWDNLLISWMHTRLFFGMLLRLPRLLKRRWGNNG